VTLENTSEIESISGHDDDEEEIKDASSTSAQEKKKKLIKIFKALK
jgi:hypothetical protein